MLKATDLFKTFHFPACTPVLKGICLEIQKGESLAIVGKSGEGKTTLLHILGSLEKPDAGEIEIAGTKVSSETQETLRSKHIGFIFQNHNLLEDFTVLENVLMPAWVAKRAVKPEEGIELLSLVGMEKKSASTVKLLSGGEKQRVSIARALINNPDLILADELSGNLDRTTSEQVRNLLFSLVKLKKKSLILVTHDLELASFASSQFELKEGKLFPR